MVSGSKKQRSGDDRRTAELGPPAGWRERRKAVERRLPEVKEIPFSEWLGHLEGAHEEALHKG
jgi:hypothetical protein